MSSDCQTNLAELRIQIEFLRKNVETLRRLSTTDSDLHALLVRVEGSGLMDSARLNTLDIKMHQSVVRKLLSAYNVKYRLRIADRSTFPRQQLVDLAKACHPFQLLPPPTPCEYVEEEFAWWCWGLHDRESEWIGHGYFWRPQDHESAEPLDNMAGSSLHDYDVLEDGFARLQQANIFVADYDLLRRDFADDLAGRSEAEIDSWLLENSAYLSAGQLARLKPGGDHHNLLGLHEPEKAFETMIDMTKKKAGIRNRSGGRAVTFLVEKEDLLSSDADDRGNAWSSPLCAPMLNVKGVGTHAGADHGANVRNTGLLNLSDALRELAMQRLVQRIAELEGTPWGTCQTYAVIDTGLRYAPGQCNPATGWEGERCALLVRQRHSRAFCHYRGYNFSGVLLMTGEDHPPPSVATGCALSLRRALTKFGVSSEQCPSVLLQPAEEEALADLDGCWNIQCDAALTHFMDFSDFYVLPDSPLPAAFRMSEGALRDAFCLEREGVRSKALAHPALRQRLFAMHDEQSAVVIRAERVAALSQDAKIRNAAVTVTETGNGASAPQGAAGRFQVQPGPPKFCQCWFMELDDSEVSRLALAEGGGMCGRELWQRIEEWLPAALPPALAVSSSSDPMVRDRASD